MELNDNDYILGVWFAEKEALGNWMCIIKKGEKPNSWIGQYRFRYFKDGRIFDSKDTYNVVDFETDNETEKCILEKINILFEVIKVKYTDIHDFLEIKGSVKKMNEMAAKTTWMHVKVEEISSQKH